MIIVSIILHLRGPRWVSTCREEEAAGYSWMMETTPRIINIKGISRLKIISWWFKIVTILDYLNETWLRHEKDLESHHNFLVIILALVLVFQNSGDFWPEKPLWRVQEKCSPLPRQTLPNLFKIQANSQTSLHACCVISCSVIFHRHSSGCFQGVEKKKEN